ncbi:MAG: DNA polymerase III subunit delta' [Flavobacteriales bacterium]|nr:DNA polymerase III subunit delta' [Flavobacteriales bacterium]
MLFDEILGHDRVIEHLKNSVDSGKVSHAQMFSGPEGSGILQLAFAYAQYVLCSQNKTSEACYKKVSDLNHPDLHFVYPVNTNTVIKSKPISRDFIKEWQEFILDDKFASIQDWYEKIGIDKKAGRIGVDEAADIVKNMMLKAYEGDFKIMIIWMPELMNIQTANKLLKLIEEPSGKSLFIFVTENEESIIKTILSRTQIVYIKRLSDDNVKNYLIDELNIDATKAADISIRVGGNVREAKNLLIEDEEEGRFQELFVDWVRGSFKADIKMLIDWADLMATNGKQFQINFLKYAVRVFRQALLENYEAKELSFLKLEAKGFRFESFIKFVHGQNIFDLINEIDLAIFHIERNGNPRIILLDVSVKITRGLHKKYKA